MSGICLGDGKTDFTLLLPLTHLFQKSNNLLGFFSGQVDLGSLSPTTFWDIFSEPVCSQNIFLKI